MWNARCKSIRDEHRAELKGPGLGLRRLGSNGSRARAVEQLLQHLWVRRWRWQMMRLSTKPKRISERDLGRLGWPARTGPEARLLGAGGASLPACHPEAVSAAFTAAVEWRLMIEANTCTTQWRIGVGNGKLERISKKLDQISQKLEPN